MSKVLSQGFLLRGRYVNLYCAPFFENRVAYVIKKSIRGAVRRNRVRRRIREAWRFCKEGAKNNISICIIAKEGVENIKFNELLDDLKKLISRIK